MKAKELLTSAVRFLPAASVVVLASQIALNPSHSFAMRTLLYLAAFTLFLTVAESITLKDRVARLEKLLTALNPESARYRKEINDYDVHPTEPLTLPPQK